MNNKISISLKLLILLIASFYAVSIFHPARWNWSTFSTFGTAVSEAILCAIILLTFVPPVSKYFLRLLTVIQSAWTELFGRLPRMIKAFLWMAIPAVIFFLLRTHSYFLGDGRTVISNLITRRMRSPSMYGSAFLMENIADLVRISNKAQAELFFAILSITSGIVFIIFGYKIINLIVKDSRNRNLLFLLLATSAISILFTGYAEIYPGLVAWLAVYLYFSLKYLKGKGKAYGPILAFIPGLAWHLWFIAFMPSLLYVYNTRLRIISGKILAGLSVLYLAGIYLGGQIVRRGIYHISIPIVSRETGYTLFSSSHFVDFVNELIIIGPLLAIMALLLIFFLKKSKVGFETKFLLFAAIPALGMSFIIDPILGASKDWDLLSIYGLPMILLGLTILAKQIELKSAVALLIPGMLLLNIFHTSGFIANNKNAQLAVDRVVRISLDDPHYSADYYKGAEVRIIAVILANEYHRYEDAFKFLNIKIKAGIALTQDAMLLARYSYLGEQYQTAVQCFELVDGKAEFSAKERFRYGHSLYNIGEYSRAIDQFRQSLMDTCTSEVGLYTAISFAYDHNQLDSCKKYCEISIRCSRDPLQAMHNIALYLPGPATSSLKAYYASRLLAAYPDSMAIRKNLIDLFQKAGMPDSARYYMNFGNHDSGR